MNHIAVMPETFRPKGIFVHWWVTQKGKEKISKSKGGAEHIAKAAQTYGVDAMRLYYTHVGSPFVDIEWDTDTVLKYKTKITGIYKLFLQVTSLDGSKNEHLDQWLISMMNRRVQQITDAFNHFDLRVASNLIFFDMQKDLQWYLKRGGDHKPTLNRFLENWLLLITPVTPHLAEELWHRTHDSFVSCALYPKVNDDEFSDTDEVGEYLLSRLIDDAQEIVKVTKITPKHLYIYTSPPWKQEVYRRAIDLADEGNLAVGPLIKELMNDPAHRAHAKELSQFVGKLPSDIKKLNDQDKHRFLLKLDEKASLQQSKDYLEQVFSCSVTIFSADDAERYDPAGKARFAVPLRPALYFE